MNKEDLKQLIKELTAEMDSEKDSSKKEALSLQLQRAVETYVQMCVPTNRMMITGGSNE